MTGQAPQYQSDNPNADAFDEDITDDRVASYGSRGSVRGDLSVPLPRSNRNREPDRDEYISPLLRKRKAVISSGVLAGVSAAATVAILVTLLSPNATRDIAVATRDIVVNVRASMGAVFSAPTAAAASDPSQAVTLEKQTQVAVTERQNLETVNESARASVPENPTPDQSVTTGAAQPARDEVKLAYQSAPPDRAPAQSVTPDHAPAAEAAPPPAEQIHHLDPDAIVALLRRADGLIASGDVAAARLVLRRAAEAGDASAAMTLAETYDPANLAKWGVHGIVPDISMARSWYEKARQFGSAAAPRRLEMLAGKQQ